MIYEHAESTEVKKIALNSLLSQFSNGPQKRRKSNVVSNFRMIVTEQAVHAFFDKPGTGSCLLLW